MLRAAAVLLSCLAACQSAPSDGVVDREERACTLVVLRTGPRTEPLSREESARLFGGHFANMERLAKSGDLLLAGPYGRNKSAPDLRGLFVFATSDIEAARKMAETDPCFEAGVFRYEYFPLRTRFPLDECAAAVMEQLAAAEREGRELPPGYGCRNYVLLTLADHTGARAFGMEDVVCLQARLDDRRALLVLACDDLESAQVAVGRFAAGFGEYSLDEWFATEFLVSLSR